MICLDIPGGPRHDWESVAVTNCTTSIAIWTIVLQRCKKCGRIRTYNIDGQWTLEQIRS